MRSEAAIPRIAELSTQNPENFIRVENCADSVVIRAARNNFSERRKSFFIRHLATEGYIPADYAWSPADGGSWGSRLQWIVDSSWGRTGPEPARRATPFMIRLMVYGSLLWLELMALLLLYAR